MHSYAGFWKRFAAYVIDTIVTYIAIFIIAFVFGFIFVAANPETDQQTLEAIGNILGLLLAWLYFAAMESSPLQATLGKLALGIRVTDMDGKRISFGRASGRYFAKIVSTLILLFGYFMAGWTEKKQGLHDIMASCLVVNKN